MASLVRWYVKLCAMFPSKGKNAAQAWKEAEGDAQHAFWLYAAPVNLLLGRDSFFLSEPAPLAIESDDSIALVDSLNQHFANDGYHFYIQAGVWFLGMDADPEIKTIDVTDVVNKDISEHLPKGEGALAWATLQNEMQMLLFSHPVNQAREAQGQLAVNSLWCYGLGAIT